MADATQVDAPQQLVSSIQKAAEREGFEPPGGIIPPAVFETAPIDHSGISPRASSAETGQTLSKFF